MDGKTSARPAGRRPIRLHLLPNADDPSAGGPTDEESFLRRLKARDPAAERMLWDRFSSLVRGLLRRGLGPDELVEDGVQECFLRLFENIARVEEASALRSYVVSVTLNILRMELRRRKMRTFFGFFSHERVEDEDAIRLSTPSADPAERFALARLYEILGRLRTEERLAFVLRHVEGMELTEVAGALGVSLATAKRRIARASRRVTAQVERDPVLAEYLSRREPPEGDPDDA